MKRPTPRFVCLAFGWLLSASSMAAEAPDQFTTALFDGQTLAGWHVAGCEASVKDGAIAIDAGNGLLRTDARYTDFVLELEWKALRPGRWDSGIYFRAELPPEGVPWPKRYQANLLKGMEGNVGGLEGATSEGLTKPGEWNHFKLSVVGTTAAMEINGQPAWKADGLPLVTGPGSGSGIRNR